MSDRIEARPILEVAGESGMAPDLPEGLEPAIKFVNPDWTTHGGFSWFNGVGWIEPPDGFNPETCVAGGLHVADTMAAAQSGGARPFNCLYVGVKPSGAGPWEDGKRKAKRVYVAGPLDLIGIIRRHGPGADLDQADCEIVSGWFVPASEFEETR